MTDRPAPRRLRRLLRLVWVHCVGRAGRRVEPVEASGANGIGDRVEGAVAESIERHVRTLDALHLATALLVGDAVTVATHDATMTTVATHLGLPVIDPVLRPGSRL